MLLDGISIKGSYHKVNQDFFITRSIDKGFVAVLSDGLGSIKHSQKGSKAICKCAVKTAVKLGEKLLKISPKLLMKKLHKQWLRKIRPYKPKDCYATLLLFIVYGNRGIAIRLGDGFIGIWHDGGTDILSDYDEDKILNVTHCLSEKTILSDCAFAEFTFSKLYGGVMCSDGIEISDMREETLRNFTREFVEGYRDMAVKDISKDIYGWLKKWHGNDDKTLAYFISERN